MMGVQLFTTVTLKIGVLQKLIKWKFYNTINSIDMDEQIYQKNSDINIKR